MVNYTLKQLYSFEAVVRLGSFTKASKHLNITQPAVYTQVQQLQKNLNTRLYDLNGKKITPTFVGLKLYQTATEVIEKLAATKLDIEQTLHPDTGHLEIAVATTANAFVSRLLSKFHRQFPDTSFHLQITNRSALIEKLEQKQTELVIMGEPPDALPLVAEKLIENPLIVIAHPDHPLIGRRHSVAALEQETLITRERESGTRTTIERLTGLSFNSDIEINSNEAIIEAIQAGLGIGFVSQHSVALELKSGIIKMLDIEKFPIIRHWHIVHRSDKPLSPIAEKFRVFLKRESSKKLSNQ